MNNLNSHNATSSMNNVYKDKEKYLKDYVSRFQTQINDIGIIYGIGNRTSTFDNVEVRIAERDYSVYDNSPQIFGTIAKQPISGASDICAYYNWSSNNYIWRYYAGNNVHEDGLDHGSGYFYYNFNN